MTDRQDAPRQQLNWVPPEDSPGYTRPSATEDQPNPADSPPPAGDRAKAAPPTSENPADEPQQHVPPAPPGYRPAPQHHLGPPPPSVTDRPVAAAWPPHDPDPARRRIEDQPPVPPPPQPGRDAADDTRVAPETDRPPPSYREPTPRQQPSPPNLGEPWQPRPAERPHPDLRGPHPDRRPAPPAAPPGYPPTTGPATQPLTAPGYQPAARTAPTPPPSYADRINVDDLVPARRVPPSSGWRRAVYTLTFGLINPGQSPDDIRQAELEQKIRTGLRGHYKIGVMGKGGVGKTTVSASIGSVFAELRQQDRVVAVDADTAFGKLGSRIDPRAPGSYWELAADRHLESFADIRNRVGNNAAGLFVLAGESAPARRRVLDAAIYREATSRLDRYFSISIIDCSSTMDAPVTQEVLTDLDALIVVSSPWVDGAAAAGQTLDWLAAHEMTGLLSRTIVVLNDSDGHADKRTRSILTQQFSGHGQAVVEVPFDGNLRPGGVIDGTRQMSPKTRRRFIEIAAALAEHFPSHDHPPRR